MSPPADSSIFSRNMLSLDDLSDWTVLDALKQVKAAGYNGDPFQPILAYQGALSESMEKTQLEEGERFSNDWLRAEKAYNASKYEERLIVYVLNEASGAFKPSGSANASTSKGTRSKEIKPKGTRPNDTKDTKLKDIKPSSSKLNNAAGASGIKSKDTKLKDTTLGGARPRNIKTNAINPKNIKAKELKPKEIKSKDSKLTSENPASTAAPTPLGLLEDSNPKETNRIQPGAGPKEAANFKYDHWGSGPVCRPAPLVRKTPGLAGFITRKYPRPDTDVGGGVKRKRDSDEGIGLNEQHVSKASKKIKARTALIFGPNGSVS